MSTDPVRTRMRNLKSSQAPKLLNHAFPLTYDLNPECEKFFGSGPLLS